MGERIVALNGDAMASPELNLQRQPVVVPSGIGVGDDERAVILTLIRILQIEHAALVCISGGRARAERSSRNDAAGAGNIDGGVTLMPVPHMDNVVSDIARRNEQICA